jgi:hypothetical protein
MKALARETRAKYRLTSFRVTKTDLRRIYKDLGIRIDLWDHKCSKLRGAYFNDDLGPTVLIVKGLPVDPTVFTMAHELKHHLVDRDLPVACCEANPGDAMIEIGAEVFAAEMIFPEGDFSRALADQGVVHGECCANDLVHLKQQTKTTLSYAGLAKRAEFLGIAPPGSLAKVKWKLLEEQIFGEPVYKRFQRYRGQRHKQSGTA